MARKHSRRLLFTPTPETMLLLDELHELTGQSRAGFVSEMLDSVAPVYRDMLAHMRALRDTPEKAREHVLDLATQAHGLITQATMDFDRDDGRTVKGKRARRRRDAGAS